MTDGRAITGRMPGWRSRLAWLGGLVLGLVLLAAAWAKALDPLAFAEQISFEGLDFLLPAPWLAWMVVVAEVMLGLALIVGLRTRPVLAVTGALIVVFVFLTGRAYWRWLTGVELEGPDCGCFGNLVSRSPAEAFWQDLLLLVPGYALCWLRRAGTIAARSLARWAMVVVPGAAVGVLTILAPGLPLDDLATRLSSGVAVAELCAGSQREASERICLDLLIPELQSGRHLVVIDGLDSEKLHTAIDDLNALVGEDGLSVWVVDDAGDEERQLFFWNWGPMFEVREVPSSLLRPLYRTLPRSFLVEDGVVSKTWAGLPELESATDGL